MLFLLPSFSLHLQSQLKFWQITFIKQWVLLGCDPFNEPESGRNCFELKCVFSGAERPENYDECESNDGKKYETPNRLEYKITLCKGRGCQQSTDVLECFTKPPHDANAITLTFTDCDGVLKILTKELRCPLKCRRCSTPPSVFGAYPQGMSKVGNCCFSGEIGANCTTPNSDNTCPLGFAQTTSGGNVFCCPNSTPTPTPPPCTNAYDFQIAGCEAYYDPINCGPSPVIIDAAGNGYNLTAAGAGVDFDIFANGNPIRISWTSADSDDAFLYLDRNGNGIVDNGAELFGNITPHPAPPVGGHQRNGFLALAVYDKPENGGNNDGQIDHQDSVFSQLKLWRDTNHNGISEASELQSLSASPIRMIELDFRLSRRTDEHGNRFRYRAKVNDARGAQVGRWAWDAFFVVQTP